MTYTTTFIFGSDAVRYYSEHDYRLDDETLPVIEDLGTVVERVFATIEERAAYFQGIEDAYGWLDCALHAGPGGDEDDEIASVIERARYHFSATYLTRSGDMGTASFVLEAADLEDAMKQGVARVEKRKAYSGKLHSTVSYYGKLEG